MKPKTRRNIENAALIMACLTAVLTIWTAYSSQAAFWVWLCAFVLIISVMVVRAIARDR